MYLIKGQPDHFSSNCILKVIPANDISALHRFSRGNNHKWSTYTIKKWSPRKGFREGRFNLHSINIWCLSYNDAKWCHSQNRQFLALFENAVVYIVNLEQSFLLWEREGKGGKEGWLLFTRRWIFPSGSKLPLKPMWQTLDMQVCMFLYCGL